MLTRRELLKATAAGAAALTVWPLLPGGASKALAQVDFWEAVAICAVEAGRRCKWLLRFPRLYSMCFGFVFARCMGRLLA